MSIQSNTYPEEITIVKLYCLKKKKKKKIGYCYEQKLVQW